MRVTAAPSSPADHAIADPVRVDSVTKRYAKRTVLDDVSVQVAHGELTALLGPNGAGKTTLLELISGLRKPDAGTVRVLDNDPRRAGHRARARVGVMLQAADLEPDLKGREYLGHIAQLYPRAADPAELLELLGMTSASGDPIRHLSGGQKRRLELAAALVGEPDVLVLDEPTTGIDPASRKIIWQTIDAARRNGAAVLMSTHMVNEAAELCDRVAVLLHGRLVAHTSPAEFVRDHTSSVTFECAPPEQIDLPESVAHLATSVVHLPDERWRLNTKQPEQLLRAILRWIDHSGVEIKRLGVSPPDFEDYYLGLLAELDMMSRSAIQ